MVVVHEWEFSAMLNSKPCPKVRHLRRSPRVHVEPLEDRLQPGSVLFGLGLSLFGSSPPDLDVGLVAPEDPSAQMVHSRPKIMQDGSLPADFAVQTLVTSGSSTAVEANAAVTPAQQEIVPALPLTSDMLALSAG